MASETVSHDRTEDASAVADAATRSGAGRMRRIVDDPRLRRRQHAHSAAVTVLSAAGALVALYIACFVDPRPLFYLFVFSVFFFPIGLGVTVGFHRHFTHRAFRAPVPIRVILAVLGSMAAQGPLTFWVALHRLHHELADRPGDPHSPNLHASTAAGLAHAYAGWTVRHEVPNANFYARDLLRDPVISWVNGRYYWWVALGLLGPAMVGFLSSGTMLGALEGFLWGGPVRMLAGHNIIWMITSFAHVVGDREFACRDRSTNNAWLALPTLGESWHNTHHAFPQAAYLGTRWWQLDPSGVVIRLLGALHLAHDIQLLSEADLLRRRLGPSNPSRKGATNE
jgi:stearoyl-CoA desaturase (delta-9 desaturase)